MYEDDHPDFYHDELERDWDEPYTPENTTEDYPGEVDDYYPDPDAEYENRYDLGDEPGDY